MESALGAARQLTFSVKRKTLQKRASELVSSRSHGVFKVMLIRGIFVNYRLEKTNARCSRIWK